MSSDLKHICFLHFVSVNVNKCKHMWAWASACHYLPSCLPLVPCCLPLSTLSHTLISVAAPLLWANSGPDAPPPFMDLHSQSALIYLFVLWHRMTDVWVSTSTSWHQRCIHVPNTSIATCDNTQRQCIHISNLCPHNISYCTDHLHVVSALLGEEPQMVTLFKWTTI